MKAGRAAETATPHRAGETIVTTLAKPEEGAPAMLAGLEDVPDPPLSSYAVEDWIAFAFFWALALVVFLQFFTRYVLNDSLAWTEEIARYLLIGVAFVGAVTATRKNTHIHVEFFYVYLPRGVALVLSAAVDLVRIAFFAYATWLAWKVAAIMQTQRMVVIDWPLSWVYYPVVLGFAAMTVRAVQVAVAHWQAGESALTRTQTEGRSQ